MRAAPLVALCTGYFLVILDSTAVNVAVPAIGADLHAATAGLQWVIDGYTVVFAGLLLTAGVLGDRLGARRVFRCGLAVFALASAVAAVAPGLPTLVGARLVQGVGAALMVPTSLALIRAAYPEPAARDRAIGIWAAVAGGAAAGGPVVGGLLVSIVDWRAIFVVNLPIGLAASVLVARTVPAARPDRSRAGFDVPGQVTSGIALLGLTFGLIESTSDGWGSATVLVALAVALAGAVAFVGIERRSAAPMVPGALCGRPDFSAATGVGLLMNLGFYGQLFVLTLYFQQLRGFTAIQTGLALLPEGLVVFLGSWLGSMLTARVGPRGPMALGMVVGAAGFGGLALVGAHTAYPLLILPLAAAGLGMSTTMPAATAAVVGAAPGGQAGVAAGVLNASRQVGSAVGVALLGAFVAGTGFVAGLRLALLTAAAAFLLAAALAALARRPPEYRSPPVAAGASMSA